MNGRVQEAAGFIDATLQNEGAWYRAEGVESRVGGALGSYGSSVGAVRGTVRDAGTKFKDLGHDEVTALASLLWGRPGPGRRPVYERRLAAVVLLQSRVALLRHSDLTRLEGFIRTAQTGELVDPLIADVVVPLLQGLGESGRQRADVVITRWHQDPDDSLRHAARLIASQGPDLQRISGNRDAERD
ncbi:DNA alkylation repair protein [Pseudarthrobacter raffinosi]|uniref:DNA alkylation repair protein n=1 Tax=Pseudarthrobacter raffinosi TaxID=2953651 RepID=UPI00208F5386|nr:MULTISPECIES: DNA alkylation repair protein [unclassified Pseudarthrobacter]MCO4237131.1 DNA alkylation repair protein [Pseudarthrobacter sp. MDT3-28]MCO4251477.1 DNA alkylation repair protein [Pseudarthrobacter sp. MDT3-9]MCO4261963.1 DNA alkylation repair protein [Pseudarthrobacter sp. MDT3-26]